MKTVYPFWLLAFVIATTPLLCCCLIPGEAGASTDGHASACGGHCPQAPAPDDAPAPVDPEGCDCHDAQQFFAEQSETLVDPAAAKALPDVFSLDQPALFTDALICGRVYLSGDPPSIPGADRCVLLGVLRI